ncbi:MULTISPECIES: MaoC family dehydratase [Paenibacillus]|uniref:MaoC-like domain-containing protein n=1 Tax=Paenibacillus albilobatus TaxID=2716884 RepID=A0A919XG25_9BACL|nr:MULTISPECIES: MaoC family dehydratase [Paenibacillus]GIO31049.1 hypothetical protein J2TS6_21900 [Paenibacillus albilobatus]
MNIRITAEAVRQYALASKDVADIHLSREAAAKAGYERPVVHGMYLMGLAQSLYLADHREMWITSCAMKFLKPLFADSVAAFDFKAYDGGEVRVTVTAESGEIVAMGHFSVKGRP